MKSKLIILQGLFGVNLRAILSLRFLPRYFKDVIYWKQRNGNIDLLYPVLSDYTDKAGSAKGHYFHQDLYVATKINHAKPSDHLDIGSRIDGFVAHVASFMNVTVADVRPSYHIPYSRIKFIQQDVINSVFKKEFDSVSSLHAIEHFGLGRYGDPIDPDGHKKGLNNIISAVSLGGTLYLGLPISTVPRIEFNAHRVFHPSFLVEYPNIKSKFQLVEFSYVDDNGAIQTNQDPLTISSLKYGCGIYIFHRTS